MDQHPVVRRHVREPVAHLLSVLRKLYQVLLDLQQDRAVFLVAVYGLYDELLQVDACAVCV